MYKLEKYKHKLFEIGGKNAVDNATLIKSSLTEQKIAYKKAYLQIGGKRRKDPQHYKEVMKRTMNNIQAYKIEKQEAVKIKNKEHNKVKKTWIGVCACVCFMALSGMLHKR